MAGLRRHAPAPVDVREALIAKLSGHVREEHDPRWDLYPREQWPSPMPPYRDPTADLLDDLRAGRPVVIEAWRLKSLVEVPRACGRLVRVGVDGSLSEAPYARVVDSSEGS